MWVKRQKQSVLVSEMNRLSIEEAVCFLQRHDVNHCTNDFAMYRSLHKRFEKKFDLKSDDHIDVYLGNRIVQDRAKGTVAMS